MGSRVPLRARNRILLNGAGRGVLVRRSRRSGCRTTRPWIVDDDLWALIEPLRTVPQLLFALRA